ncbi:hypothetical protein PVBG_05985 [Plasmodium vivax Brazil I]|uniref:Variable surface protein Vir35 n=1 Tax=Plasmodium vivax (strain Brazil I) TaxID=1033975 RepID=A0A0J9T2R2_PLAV1|nr:hypothetical protein PVBG_05985 [Plasmodium vivax Brazil I]
MADLKNYDLRKNKNYIYIFKIVTVVILMWMHIPYHYMGNSNRSLDKSIKIDKILEIHSQRSLAKQEYKKNLDSSSMKERLPDYRIHMEIKNKKNVSTYGHLNKDGLNKLDAYKKSYKNRYAKKNWLAKLDCYFEKKVFDKIDNICNLAEKMHNDKKKYLNKIHIKYTIFFILLSLLPLLALIFPTVISLLYPDGKYVTLENGKKAGGTVADSPFKNYTYSSITKTTWDAMNTVNSLLSCMLPVVVIIVVLYIFIKFLKYEKLKTGKTKMGVMDYCNLCKDAFKIF